MNLRTRGDFAPVKRPFLFHQVTASILYPMSAYLILYHGSAIAGMLIAIPVAKILELSRMPMSLQVVTEERRARAKNYIIPVSICFNIIDHQFS